MAWRTVFEHKGMWAEEGMRVGENIQRSQCYLEQECAKEVMREIEINLKSWAVPRVTQKDQVTPVEI